MSPEEDAALERLGADTSAQPSGYQGGGEPVLEPEVLETPLLCFHDPRVAQAFHRQIDEMLAFDGVRGVALDYIGYRNYRGCFCPTSEASLAAFRESHPELTPDEARTRHALETLVAFSDGLATHARATKPGAIVATHVYPVFLPEPLYGNRLDVDVCAQTAAWFFEPFWELAKVRQYAATIVGDAQRFHPHAQGAPFIGYGRKPRKSPERLEAEFRAVLDARPTRVHMHSLNALLEDPEACAVVRRHAGR